MHITASDLAAAGRSTTFTFREARVPAVPPPAPDRDRSRSADEEVAATPAQTSRRSRPVDGLASDAVTRRLDLVRHVVEQIIGHALSAAEIDAIAQRPQPVPVAFDQARQAEAVARRAVAWSATLDLREVGSGDGTFAASGTVRAPDGREIGLEVRLAGNGETAVMPLRLDVQLDGEGRAESLVFAGRAVDGGAGTGAAATAAAWNGLPVRVHGADGALHVATLADARSAVPGGGGDHIDLVA
jgi:hypothetical protein